MRHAAIGILVVMALALGGETAVALPSSAGRADPATTGSPRELRIGWASADLTPSRPVLVAGQTHARVSEGVADPITATALRRSRSGVGRAALSRRGFKAEEGHP